MGLEITTPAPCGAGVSATNEARSRSEENSVFDSRTASSRSEGNDFRTAARNDASGSTDAKLVSIAMTRTSFITRKSGCDWLLRIESTSPSAMTAQYGRSPSTLHLAQRKREWGTIKVRA